MEIPIRMTVTKDGPEQNDGPWLQKLGTSWPPYLNPSMIVQSDGERSIIREIPRGTMSQYEGQTSGQSDEEAGGGGEQPPICIPVEILVIGLDPPPDDPYTVGETITFTPTLVGSTPMTIRWFINGVLVASTSTLVYTVAEGDIVDKDEFGLGHFSYQLIVTNACGEDTVGPLNIEAQGEPPP